MSDQETAEVNYSFGQRLSSARRALNLTQEQVAAELRLNISLIKALEEEDYTNLPTQMYIAGYLRNYARLLKMPVEPLLSALDKAKLESPSLITDVSRPRKATHSKLLVKLFVLVLLVVVVAGIVNWIQSQDHELFSNKQVGSGAPDQLEQLEAEVLPEPLSERLVDEPVVSEAPEAQTSPEPAAEQVAPLVEEVARTEEVVTPEVAVPETAIQEVANQSEQPEIVKAGVELVLMFSDDCWAEVKDSNSEQLAYDLYRDGQVKKVSGIPPFSIFLGNASAVTIEYNGQPYDASVHIRGNLARFRLGQTDDYKSTTE